MQNGTTCCAAVAAWMALTGCGETSDGTDDGGFAATGNTTSNTGGTPGGSASGGSGNENTGAVTGASGSDGEGGLLSGNVDRTACGGANQPACECTGPCCPTEAFCYGAESGGKNPQRVGDECLAQRDNSVGGLNGERLQYRQSWARTIAPPGNKIMQVYQVLAPGSTLPTPECNMPATTLASGFMQLLDVDLTDPDPMNHTTTSGYAPWFSAQEYGDIARPNGLCMVEGTYDNPEYRLGSDQMSSTEDWPAGLPAPMPQPWTVRATVTVRRMTDFDVKAERLALLDEIAQRGSDGLFFRDPDTGYSHGYAPISWVYVASGSNTNAFAVPIREAETIYYTNDTKERSCMGAYRANKLPADICDSTDQENPTWGWYGAADIPGEAPATTQGYFLITEIEQVFSTVLGRTLCTHYPQPAESEKDGFPGTACRDSAKWDPTAPNNAGLPTGDWCAATNGPATKTCHDAFRSVSYHTFSAHDLSEEPCPLSGYEPLTE